MPAAVPPAPRAILAVQLRRLGDAILAAPALDALKSAHPRARLDLLVEPPGAEALAGHPALDEVLIYRAGGPLEALRRALEIRRRRYDWVVDFLATPRTALLTALSGARVRAGPGHTRRRWAYNVRLPQSTRTCYAALEKIRMLAPLGIAAPAEPPLPRLGPALGAGARPGPFVGLVPASRRATRAWPAESFARLGRLLRERRGLRAKVFAGPGEEGLAARIAAGIGPEAEAPRTPALADLARELAACRLVVSNCAGPKHLACALGVPTVTVHGSSDPAAWTPPHPLHRAVRLDDLECIGCRLNECPYGLECLRQLPAERVLVAAEELLSAAEPAAAPPAA